jgi:hypothetical protein
MVADRDVGKDNFAQKAKEAMQRNIKRIAPILFILIF